MSLTGLLGTIIRCGLPARRHHAGRLLRIGRLSHDGRWQWRRSSGGRHGGATVEIVRLRVHHDVARYQFLQFGKLGLLAVRRRAVTELEMRAVFGKLFDGVAAVEQLALVLVDIVMAPSQAATR